MTNILAGIDPPFKRKRAYLCLNLRLSPGDARLCASAKSFATRSTYMRVTVNVVWPRSFCRPGGSHLRSDCFHNSVQPRVVYPSSLVGHYRESLREAYERAPGTAAKRAALLVPMAGADT